MNRAVDVVLACLLIIFAGPLMAFVALATKVNSPGPVTCRCEGVWLDGRRRRNLLKFRTTASQATSTGCRAPRTRVGQCLYLTRIEDLPELFDVLRGDLSIISALKHPASASKRHG